MHAGDASRGFCREKIGTEGVKRGVAYTLVLSPFLSHVSRNSQKYTHFQEQSEAIIDTLFQMSTDLDKPVSVRPFLQ